MSEHEFHNEACGCMPASPPAVVYLPDSADLGASKPVPQPQPKLRPLEHPVVISCGHSLDTRHFPVHANCEDCWLAFFESNSAGLASVHELLMVDGTRAVTAIHGAKFTRAFGRYLQNQLLKMYQKPQTEDGVAVLSLTEIAQGD